MIIHFILSGETLESISEEINLENPKYLKEFHNSHCAGEDMIYDNLVPRKKLFMPDITKIREYNSLNDAPFKHPKLNPDIPFHPENFSKIYSVVSRETGNDGLEEKNSTLTYTVSVKWMRTENNEHLFQLFKNNFSESTGSMMADLAAESMRSLNPVEVKTDLRGNIVHLSLPEETVRNFGRIKERLADLFPDSYAEIYLAEFERAVLDQHLFSSRMKEDVFTKIYFASLRNGFVNGKSDLRQSIGEENMPIHLVQQVENPEYDGEIIIQQTMHPREDDKDFTATYTVYSDSGMVKEIDIRTHLSQFGTLNNSSMTITELT